MLVRYLGQIYNIPKSQAKGLEKVKKRKPKPKNTIKNHWARKRKQYHKFLQSKQWAEIRERLISDEMYQKCAICQREDVQLHHATYVDFDKDPSLNIVPLCVSHHKEVHNLQRKNKITVSKATNETFKKYGY